MSWRGAIAAIGAAIVLSLTGNSPARSQDLNSQLQTAVESQEWSQALAIVDLLIARSGSTEELNRYRERLSSLAAEQIPSVPSQSSTISLNGVPLATVASHLNQGLPRQVDDTMELVSVSASGNRLIYKGRLLAMPTTENEANRYNSRFYKDSVARALCPQPAILNVLEQGIELQYVLLDSENSPLMTVNMTSKTCQS